MSDQVNHERPQYAKVASGTNVVRKHQPEIFVETAPQLNPEAQHWIQVREVFLTLQGEGPFSGRRAVFIRLTGCHLSCVWCDTTWNDVADPTVSVPDIVTRAEAHWGSDIPDPLIVITGGEPLRQPIGFLVSQLRTRMKAHIQIETSGSFYRGFMSDAAVTTVVSPKTPTIDKKIMEVADAWKYVISAEDEKCPHTGIPITATQPGSRPARLCAPPPWVTRDQVYLSPCDTQDPAKNYANLQEASRLAVKHGYTLGVQLHKLVDLP